MWLCTFLEAIDRYQKLKKMSAANITILATHTVTPLGAQAHEGPMYMTAWDQIFGVIDAKTVLFYNPNSAQEWAAKVETLRSSLARALTHFSPLAGRLRWVDDGGHRLEIECNGEGAKVVEAECDQEMSFFLDRIPEKLKRLVPVVDYEGPVDEAPLLLVQITRFRCGGVALGISMSHAVADGVAAFHFFSEWARLARGEPLKEAPYLDRTIFKATKKTNIEQQLSFSDHIEFENPPLLLRKEDSVGERNKETTKVVLPLTKAQMDALKKAAGSTVVSKNGEEISRSFSRYEVIAAHIWRCACKARGNEKEQPTAVSIAIDMRSRIRTIPLPQRYFGNTILSMRAMSRAGDLISNPLGFACGKLREAIKKVDENYIWSNIELLEKKEDLSFYGQDIRVLKTTKEGKPYHGNPNFRVISWLTLPLDGIDFGWGNNIDIIPIARDLDGSSFLLPSLQNDGSIVVVLCLQLAHVDKFKKHFYEDIHV